MLFRGILVSCSMLHSCKRYKSLSWNSNRIESKMFSINAIYLWHNSCLLLNISIPKEIILQFQCKRPQYYHCINWYLVLCWINISWFLHIYSQQAYQPKYCKISNIRHQIPKLKWLSSRLKLRIYIRGLTVVAIWCSSKALGCLKSPVDWLFVQKLVQTIKTKTLKPHNTGSLRGESTDHQWSEWHYVSSEVFFLVV